MKLRYRILSVSPDPDASSAEAGSERSGSSTPLVSPPLLLRLFHPPRLSELSRSGDRSESTRNPVAVGTSCPWGNLPSSTTPDPGDSFATMHLSCVFRWDPRTYDSGSAVFIFQYYLKFLCLSLFAFSLSCWSNGTSDRAASPISLLRQVSSLFYFQIYAISLLHEVWFLLGSILY